MKHVLPAAELGGYAVGAFSPRYTSMIRPILRAGGWLSSPLIVQIAESELALYGITAQEFAGEFLAAVAAEKTMVPVVLHLDHTREFSIVKQAITAGFTSVMIDASHKPLDENIALSREVAQFGHARGVSVEAELGRIGTTDRIETDEDLESYTDPQEAKRFVDETGVDALAVSVGTAHGVYTVRQPRVDYDRLTAIRRLTPVHLVLHGGSGVPPEMMIKAFELPGGGVSKVNIATDLELALLGALGRSQRMTNAECQNLSPGDLALARTAVEHTVMDKMTNFVKSAGRAT